MAYSVWETNRVYGPRKGLEGPFTFVNGQVLYYDAKEGQYWDPRSDFYVSNQEMSMIHGQLIQTMMGR